TNIFILLLTSILLMIQIIQISHSLTFFCTESPGAQGIPEFVSVGLVDEVQIVDCNNIRGLEVHKDWIKFFKDDPQHVEWYASQCLNNHHFFKANIESLRQRLNQTEGVHIMQRMCGCEWDDETGELNGFNQFGYDAEDFIALDLQTLTWIAPKPQALITKLSWDTEKARLEANKYILGHECPKYLKKYVQYGKNLLESAVLPSVSLLQKSPSSPISCHATGFYPHRAVMFWRKDGEEIHEGVDHGEILPNNDGTFQMSVDLKLSSVTPADWERYDCVFQLSDVSSDIITKLDKAVIRTNMGKTGSCRVWKLFSLSSQGNSSVRGSLPNQSTCALWTWGRYSTVSLGVSCGRSCGSMGCLARCCGPFSLCTTAVRAWSV
uniref:Ig-like domain-containing protein n=1 Tax=Amphilophus citrinellus TaxID=61819 RepID=A0A3Q0TAJ5_AMPCI